MADRDENTGRYTGKYPDKKFLDTIKNQDGMVGTGEIANTVGCAHDTAYKRLQKLENEEKVSSQKVGNTLVWSLVDSG